MSGGMTQGAGRAWAGSAAMAVPTIGLRSADRVLGLGSLAFFESLALVLYSFLIQELYVVTSVAMWSSFHFHLYFDILKMVVGEYASDQGCSLPNPVSVY